MMPLFSLLKRFARHEARAFWVGVFLALIPVVSGILLLGVAGWFITASALAGGTVLALTFDVFRPGAIIRFLALSRTAGRYFERLTTHEATFRYIALLRKQVFSGISKLSGQAQGRLRRGLALSRLTTDLEAVEALYLRVFLPVFIALLVGIILCVCLAFISPLMALVIGFFYSASALLAPLLAYRLNRKNARRTVHATDALRLRIADLEAGATELAIFGRRTHQVEKTEKSDDILRRAQSEQDRINRMMRALVGFVGQSLVVVTMVMGTYLYSENQVSGPVLVALILVSLTALETVQASVAGCVELAKTSSSAKRILSLTQTTRTVDLPVQITKASKVSQTGTTAALNFCEVDFRYDQNPVPVVSKLSFTLSPGGKAAFIGSSGCGKSTILNLAAGLLQADGGSIKVNGCSISQFADSTLRSLISMVGQRTELFNDTIAGNLRLANPSAANDELWWALEQVGLADMIHEREGRLDHLLGERGHGLSGGESRRLVIARTLLKNAPIWIVDELTEGIDKKTAEEIVDRLSSVLAEKTILMATHRQLELNMVEQLHVIDSGILVRSIAQSNSELWQSTKGTLRPD
ncbi:MAG: thiol reductant ABC exporter subunit CydC [Stappiaceae bacterium]